MSCGQPFSYGGGCLHLWVVLSINGWPVAFVGGQFCCSLSLAWGAVLWLSLVASLCGGYGG